MTASRALRRADVPRERLPDWEERLQHYLLSARAQAHEYGQHDCLLHPAAAVEALTGADLGAGHRGAYRSQASAVRHLRSVGYGSPEELLDSLFDGCSAGFAQRGDLVLTPANAEGEWEIPGVCLGDNAFCVSPIGFVREPRARWIRAWKVGR